MRQEGQSLLWRLTPRRELASAHPPSVLLSNLRDGTARFLTHNLYGDNVVSLSLSQRVFVWHSCRTFHLFLPRPVFWGRVLPEGAGSRVSGFFVAPGLPVLVAATSVAAVVGGFESLMGASFVALLVLFLSGRLSRAFLESDANLVWSVLSRATGAPAA